MLFKWIMPCFVFLFLGCKKRLILDEIHEVSFQTVQSSFLNQFFYTSDASDKDFIANKQEPALVPIVPHNKVNAFPDLHYELGKLYVVYRSSTKHLFGSDGIILLEVYDTSFNFLRRMHIFSEPEYDCRDPKVLRLSGDTLLVHYYSYVRNESDRIVRKRRKVLKYLDINTGNVFKEYKYEGDFDEIPWHWHLTPDPFIKGVFHSWGYNLINFSRDTIIPGENLFLRGKNFIDIGGRPSEGFTRFNHLNVPVSIVRRVSESIFSVTEGEKLHLIDLSLGEIGGPNFLYLNNRTILFSGRIKGKARIYKFDLFKKRVFHLLDLPSKGDMGYFGMDNFQNTLFVAYYSTHVGDSTQVFLTKVFFSSK